MTRRRFSLAARISLLSVSIALVTALLAGALAFGLIRNSGADSARRQLGRLADVAQSVATDDRTGRLARARLARVLDGIAVRSATIGPRGAIRSTDPLIRDALTSAEVQAVLAGRDVSAVRTVDGSPVFVEARPAGRGGVVIVQRRADAVAQSKSAFRRIAVALLIAGLAAGAIGLFVAGLLARPLRRTAAAARALAAGHRDVTLPPEGPAEMVEVSEAVNSLADALRHSEARQREFLLSVSHDLRTPLTAISGYAESLAEGVVPADQAVPVGQVLLGEARRLERLIGDLLDLARLGAEDFRVELARVDLVGLAQGAARVWAARCIPAGVEFRLTAPPGPVWALTDAARLRQVLDGLFDNALRVTPAGAPIVLAAGVTGGQPVVEVRDGGPGLSDADLAVAFEQGALYERYRGVRPVGTGLGLAIAHGLVGRLGGTVEAGHAAEGGARFTVRLPAT